MTRASRVPVEWLFERARRIGDLAVSHVDAEREAVRNKTARLKAQRLAKEASEGSEPEPESKPAGSKRRS